MIRSLKARRDNEDEGFTLIELMVVVLIIAILIAIAIPTFLGAREKAQDRGAQSSLRNGLTAAKVLYADDGSYVSATPAGLLAVEPSLTFAAAAVASTGANNISVAVSVDNATFSGAALSDSGVCFWIADGGSGTTFGTGAVCTGTAAVAAAGTEW